MLVGDFAAEGVQIHAAVGGGIAVRGQGVVRAGGVVACAFGRQMSYEDAACVCHFLGECFCVGGFYYKMFGRVGVAERYHLVGGTDVYVAAVVQGFGGNVLSWQQL